MVSGSICGPKKEQVRKLFVIEYLSSGKPYLWEGVGGFGSHPAVFLALYSGISPESAQGTMQS